MFNKVVFIGRLRRECRSQNRTERQGICRFQSGDQRELEKRTGAITKTALSGIACTPGAISPASPRRFRMGSSSALKGKSNIARSRKRSRRYLQAQHRRDPRNKHEAALKSRSCGRSGRRCERGRRRSTNGTGDYRSNEGAEVAFAPQNLESVTPAPNLCESCRVGDDTKLSFGFRLSDAG
jgi:hypothetical protein